MGSALMMTVLNIMALTIIAFMAVAVAAFVAAFVLYMLERRRFRKGRYSND